MKEGTANVGDILTFGENLTRWIVKEVLMGEGEVKGYIISLAPPASEGEEKG